MTHFSFFFLFSVLSFYKTTVLDVTLENRFIYYCLQSQKGPGLNNCVEVSPSLKTCFRTNPSSLGSTWLKMLLIAIIWRCHWGTSPPICSVYSLTSMKGAFVLGKAYQRWASLGCDDVEVRKLSSAEAWFYQNKTLRLAVGGESALSCLLWSASSPVISCSCLHWFGCFHLKCLKKRLLLCKGDHRGTV